MKNFVKQFTEEEIPDVMKIGRKYFQARTELQSAMEELKINREPEHIGLFLGEEKRKRFLPAIGMLDILNEMTERKAIIDDKAEWLFLCGRDVFEKSVLECRFEKGPALVMNKKEEVLGYGVLNRGNIKIENRLDRGDFLRREMK